MKRLAGLVCLGWLLLGTQVASAASELNVVVILDNSGSMNDAMPSGEQKIFAAKKALLTVLQQVPAEAEIGVVLLNPIQGSQWLVPLGPVDANAVRTSIGQLNANGGTPLGATMKIAADELMKLRGKQRYGTYKLLIVTDGEAGDSALVDTYLPEIQARGILIDTIGVAMENDHSLATRTSTYRTADDPSSLEKAISAVVLGESTTGPDDDTGESDFELLKAFPNEVAAASLAALSSSSNEPISQEPETRDNHYSSSGGSSYPTPTQSSPQPGPQSKPGGSGPSFGMIVFCVIIIFVFARYLSAIAKRK